MVAVLRGWLLAAERTLSDRCAVLDGALRNTDCVLGMPAEEGAVIVAVSQLSQQCVDSAQGAVEKDQIWGAL